MPSEEELFAAAKARREMERAASSGVETRRASFPFDPVLRLALIDKGILTPEDLTAAEAKIITLGGDTNAPHPSSSP